MLWTVTGVSDNFFIFWTALKCNCGVRSTFLAILFFISCPGQLNRWPCHSLTHWVSKGPFEKDTNRVTPETCDLRDTCPEWWEDMTWPKKLTKTNTKTKTMTKTNTFWEHLQRAILKTWDLWDIWWEWWGDMTWPKKDNDKQKDKDKDNDKDKDILRTHPKSNPRDLWPLRHLFRVMRRHDMTKNKLTKTNTKTKTMTMT